MPTFDSKIKRAPISFSSSGDNVLVAGTAGQSIELVGLILVVAGATNLTFKDGSTVTSGAMPMSANGSIILDENPGLAWFVASAGNNLVLNNSNAVQVSGVAYFTQE